MKTILNISRLNQKELWNVIKMLPDDIENQYIITGYKIINPDDKNPQPRNVTVEEYNIEVEKYQQKHGGDVSAPGIQIVETYTKENVLAPEIVDNIKIIEVSTVPANVASAGYDLIIVGISDSGVDIFKKCGGGEDEFGKPIPEYSQFQALSDARDAGIPIIFTHDCLEVNSFCEPFPDDYMKLCGNFGVASIGHDYGMGGDNVQNITCVTPSHDIMKSYFELPVTLDVQMTHHGGIVLKPSAKVVYTSTDTSPDNANYYLATYEEAKKGKVAICLLGHSNGEFKYFIRPSIEECKILVNTIVWALQ